MRCPLRKIKTNGYEFANGDPVLRSTKEDFMVCYESECPFFDVDGKTMNETCKIVERLIKG